MAEARSELAAIKQPSALPASIAGSDSHSRTQQLPLPLVPAHSKAVGLLTAVNFSSFKGMRWLQNSTLERLEQTGLPPEII